MQINDLLSNATRTDICGQEMWLDTTTSVADGLWREPRPGFSGHYYLGHRTDVTDPYVASVVVDNQHAAWTMLRHSWSPVFQRTLYAVADQVYVEEVKWIHDTLLVMDWRLFHGVTDRAVDVTIALHGRFADASASGEAIDIQTTTSSLGKPLRTRVFVAADTATRVSVRPFEQRTVRFVCAIGRTAAEARATYDRRATITLAQALTSFEQWFAHHVPALETDDVQVLRVYYYRWFVVFRNLHHPSRWYDDHPLPGELIYESPVGSWFSAPIGLPLALQIRELRWATHLRGVDDTLAAWVRGHGALRAYIGDPLSAFLVYARHHTVSVDLDTVFRAGIAFIAQQHTRTARIQGGNVHEFPITVGSWVTGTEYAPDFFAMTDPAWDHRVSEYRIEPNIPMPGEDDHPEARQIGHLYRVDTNVFHISMIQALSQLAALIGDAPAAQTLAEHAQELLARLETLHGDATGVFRSVDAASKEQITTVLGFEAVLPFLLSHWESHHREALATMLSETHLLAPFGIRSTSPVCPAYSPDNRWVIGPDADNERPFRYPCCWNGPCWNYATSWVLIALSQVARASQSPLLKATFRDLWQRWCQAHHLPGDPALPVVMEHYHPDTAAPFRMVPDYFHSAWLDPFFRGFVGFDDTTSAWLTIDPLALETTLSVRNIPWKQQRIDVEFSTCEERAFCKVWVNDTLVFDQSAPPPWNITFVPSCELAERM